MHLFVVDILLVSTQKFESTNLNILRIYGELKARQEFTGSFINEKEEKGIGPG
jgi:hypothetical protein